MKCYYEVLNLPRDAESGEIKTSYRKLALKWHPDKNLTNAEEAKEQFQIVQNAYEVLSDPQERAWYDSHREQLLKGAGTEFSDESLDLIPFFTASCFKGFGDDSKGFYSVYREVFQKLIAEETDYMDDPEDVKKIPMFGKSDMEYEKVHEFYSYWMSFSTIKSYVWLDKYDIREADNRKILKLLEKENNKIRQKARKERNDEIRQLVSFIRKRDKRVLAHSKMLEEKTKENKKRMEGLRREKIIQRQRELEEAKQKEKDIGVYTMNNFNEQLDEIEKHLAEEFGVSEDEFEDMSSADEDIDIVEPQGSEFVSLPVDDQCFASLQNLYCMACNKPFKNVKSFENHEKSKKHKENVMNLKLDVDVELSGEEELDSSEEKTQLQNGDEASDVESSDENTRSSSRNKKKKKNKKQTFVAMDDSDSESENKNIINLESNVRGRKARRAKAVENSISSKKNKSNSKNKNDIEIDESKLEASNNLNEMPEDKEDVENEISTNSQTSKKEAKDNKNSKSKIKEKKISQKKKIDILLDTDISNIDTAHCCVTCKNEFPSKNKLFDHLKKTGHQIFLPTSQAAANIGKGKKKKDSKQK